jgi:hypothetical protein
MRACRMLVGSTTWGNVMSSYGMVSERDRDGKERACRAIKRCNTYLERLCVPVLDLVDGRHGGEIVR